MTDEVIQIILKKLENIENQIDDLTAFKNRVLGYGIALSAVFAFLFDTFKTLFRG